MELPGERNQKKLNKSAVSKFVHPTIPDFSWRSEYNDHVFHSERELGRIGKYIVNNPGKWKS
jgi:hypothetical protein